MAFIDYRKQNPKTETLEFIKTVNEIIEEYEGMGYVLTLRQLYYQLVARDIIENTVNSYKRLSSTLTTARYNGLVSWTALTDRHRSIKDFYVNEDPLSLLQGLHSGISFDYWERQPYYVEVWVEKDALGNVINKACSPWGVPHMACKGFMSASENWLAAQRFANARDKGKECLLIHLGDHDPSGIDMTRDNDDRIAEFMWGEGINVKRVALNIDQVRRYSPPPNPAKTTDSRAKQYIRKFGNESWELDALPPSVIEQLITENIKELIDWTEWDNTANEEEKVRQDLYGWSEYYNQIVAQVKFLKEADGK